VSSGDSPPWLLLLGSAPSAASLAAQRYYDYRFNHFWPIMGTLFNFDPKGGYQQRIKGITSKGIAVWDVCQQFERKGSLDSNIKAVVPNDFLPFLDAHPTITTIACNGGTSAKLFHKYFPRGELQRRGLIWIQLPSSSPAHAMADAVNQKTLKWKTLLKLGIEER